MSQPIRLNRTTAGTMAIGLSVALLGACADSPTEPIEPPTPSFEEVDEEPMCSVGLWKNDLSLWSAAGYDPQAPLSDVFKGAGQYATTSLLDALEFSGGRGKDGAARLLLRAALVAVLNDAYPGNDIDYGTDLIQRVEAALAGSRKDMLRLASELEGASDVACAIVAGPGLPDLVITQVELIGASDWRATVLNQGTTTAEVGSVAVQGFWSADGALDVPGDQGACFMSLSQTATVLAPGETATAQPGCSIAPPLGTTVLFVVVDYSDILVESDEGNNVYSQVLP